MGKGKEKQMNFCSSVGTQMKQDHYLSQDIDYRTGRTVMKYGSLRRNILENELAVYYLEWEAYTS